MIESIIGTFVFLILYKLFNNGYLPDIFLRGDERAEKVMHKNAQKNIKNEDPETAYESIKYLPDSGSKDDMLSEIAIKLSKEKFYKSADEALSLIKCDITRSLCIAKLVKDVGFRDYQDECE
tara:strand:- start:312 stop:677 length:366 start_codon:yes stop_codon:yes gene_type:complete